MSFFDLDSANPGEIVSHYLIELAGRGTMLSYADHEIVQVWLAASRDLDELLVVLSDLGPDYFARRPKPRTLAGLKRPVLSRLAKTR